MTTDERADESLELIEPAYDPPPLLSDANERRMHERVRNRWNSLRCGRRFPSIVDLDPSSLGDFGPNGLLLDVAGAPGSPALRFVGQRLREACGLTAPDASFDDLPPDSLVSRLAAPYADVLANGAPVDFEGECGLRRGRGLLYRGILMPLSSDGRRIDFMFGVLSWKEVAGADLTTRLMIQAAEALAASPAYPPARPG